MASGVNSSRSSVQKKWKGTVERSEVTLLCRLFKGEKKRKTVRGRGIRSERLRGGGLDRKISFTG